MLLPVPYGNDRRTSRLPAVTYALIASNVLIFLWLSPYDREAALTAMGLIPSHPSISSIVSSMFVHTELYHLAWNMLFLWLFGPHVEDALGHIEYTIFYFGSGFAAGLLHVVVTHAFMSAAVDTPMVGSSGAIAGILGVFAIRFYKTRIRLFWPPGILLPRHPLTFSVSAVVGLGIWFAQQLYGGLRSVVYSQSEGVAYWSHIGGMVFGMILAYALRMGVEGTKEYLMSDARASLERGTTWDAAENLRAILERDPENADAHGELARTCAIQQDSDSALFHYQRSIELYFRKGQPNKAVARFAELKHYYRNARLDLRSEHHLARYLLEINCPGPALQLFEGIAATYPGTPEAEMALMKAGDLYLNTFNNLQSAIRCYERFVREYPHSACQTMVEKSLQEARQRL